MYKRNGSTLKREKIKNWIKSNAKKLEKVLSIKMEKTRDNKQIRENKTKSSSEFMRAHTDKPLFHYPLIQRDSITSLTLSPILIPSANVGLCVRLFLFSFCHLPYCDIVCVCFVILNNWWLVSTTTVHTIRVLVTQITKHNRLKENAKSQKEAAKEWRREKENRGAHTHSLQKINK